jgi:hypothetical protein
MARFRLPCAPEPFWAPSGARVHFFGDSQSIAARTEQQFRPADKLAKRMIFRRYWAPAATGDCMRPPRHHARRRLSNKDVTTSVAAKPVGASNGQIINSAATHARDFSLAKPDPLCFGRENANFKPLRLSATATAL